MDKATCRSNRFPAVIGRVKQKIGAGPSDFFKVYKMTPLCNTLNTDKESTTISMTSVEVVIKLTNMEDLEGRL